MPGGVRGLVGLCAVCSALAIPQAANATLIPVETGAPAISGSPEQGQTLSCSQGTWANSPTGFTYTWQRAGTNILGAASSTYVPSASDVAQLITCTVVAQNAGGSSLPAISLPVVPVALPLPTVPVETAPPVVSGSPEQGQTLSCAPGSWSNSPTSFAYTWQRNATNISGATSAAYKVISSDAGQALTCTVVASNGSGSSAPAISLPTVPVALPSLTVPIETGAPRIYGSPEAGQKLACSTGTWLNSPTSYRYAWQRDGLNIAGATSLVYTVATADVGQAVTCAVVAVNSSGSSAPAISLPVLAVAAPAPVITGSGATKATGSGGKAATVAGQVARPTLLSLSLSPARVKQPAKKVHIYLNFKLDRAASVLVVIQRLVRGKWVTLGEMAIGTATAGAHRVSLTGRLARAMLRLGRYRALAGAINAGGWSKARNASVTVSKRHHARRSRRHH